MGQTALEIPLPRLIRGHQTVTVDDKDARPRFRFGQAFRLHGDHDLLGDTTTSRATANKHHALLGNGFFAGLAGRHQRTYHHRGRALHVIVEAAQFVTVTLQQRHSVGLGKIFKLQQHVRPAALHGSNKLRHKGIVLFLAYPFMAPAHVHRVIQQRLVIGAYVDHDRQRIGWANPAASGVERQLTDRNAHAADTLVAKAENPLAIGHHDHFHVIFGGATQDIVHMLAVRVADKQPPVVAVDIGELLARLANRRRVDNRQHLFQMLRDKTEIERFVVILNGTKVNMAL